MMKTISDSPMLRSQINKVLWIIVFWILVALFQFMNGYGTFSFYGFEMTESQLNQYLWDSLVTGIAGGVLCGTIIVFYWEKWLRSHSYPQSLWLIFLTYSILYLIASIIIIVFNLMGTLGVSFGDSVFWEAFVANITNLSNFGDYFFWLLVVLISFVALLVNDKYGPGILVDFLLGKYFHPKREERIFMFLDLRGSTAIAEKLGEQAYFSFIKEVFKDITPAILQNEGEIYQYVGDEVVISWKTNPKKDISRIIRCFFDIQAILEEKSDYYQQQYDQVRPEFKAGLHYGHVMAGEVGVVKRDIAYSGDVLNTTARIQSKCNELGVNLLISKYMMERLHALDSDIQPKALGEISLRSKQKSLELYTV